MDTDPYAPSLSQLHTAVNGEGLEVSGWLATWDEDSANEAFVSHAFDKSLPRFLESNPVVLHNHVKSEPPVGKVLRAKVVPHKGIYGTVLLPKPEVGTKAMEVFNSVKNGLLKSFSVGGFWKRLELGGKTKLICDRLVEVSLTGTPVNEYALAGGVASVVGVKSLGSHWVPVADYPAREREAQAWLQREVGLRDASDGLALADLRLSVAELLLR